MADFRLREQKIQLSEKDVVKACIMLLNLRHYWTRRINTGSFLTLDGRWHTEGRKGDPDYVALHATFPGFLLEFKRPGEKLRPEQEQRHFEIQLGYQIAIVMVDSKEALECWLNEHEKQH
jgi:hypothetical protein